MPKVKTPPPVPSAAEQRARRAEQRRLRAESLDRFHEQVREALAKDKSKSPATPDPVPKAHVPTGVWAKTILEAVRLFNEPQRYLQEPPLNTPLADLFVIQRILDGKGHLLTAFTDQRMVAFPTGDGHTDVLRVQGDFTKIGELAKRWANEDRKVHLAEHLEEVLVAIDLGITQGLKDAAHSEWLLTADFANVRAVWVKAEGGGDWRVGGQADSLPEGHPARGWLDPDLWFDVDGTPFLLLGGVTPMWAEEKGHALPGHGWARPFYHVKDVVQLTKQGRLFQVNDWLAGKQADAAKFKKFVTIRERYGINHRLPPRFIPIPEQSPPDDRTWVERVCWAIENLEKPHDSLKPPPSDTPLSDLLAVRGAFGVVNEARCLYGASWRMAGRWFGESRWTTLLDLLCPILTRVHELVHGHLERGLVYASTQAAQPTSTSSQD